MNRLLIFGLFTKIVKIFERMEDEIPLHSLRLLALSRSHREQSFIGRVAAPHRLCVQSWLYESKLSTAISIRKTPHWCAAPNKHCIARWGRDSNSWYPYEYGSLANCWFQPLTHPTGDCATDSRANRTAKIQLFSKKEQFFYLCRLLLTII